jgi:transcriptional regulator with XRE-family HTH domain
MTQNVPETLGMVLKLAREAKTYSLRYVEEKTKISNAYLSQLENNKIKKPAADTLFKLAEIYNINFNYLLEKAGLVEKTKNSTQPVGRFIFSKDNLTSDEQEELVRYLQFIRNKSKK